MLPPGRSGPIFYYHYRLRRKHLSGGRRYLIWSMELPIWTVDAFTKEPFRCVCVWILVWAVCTLYSVQCTMYTVQCTMYSGPALIMGPYQKQCILYRAPGYWKPPLVKQWSSTMIINNETTIDNYHQQWNQPSNTMFTRPHITTHICGITSCGRPMT